MSDNFATTPDESVKLDISASSIIDLKAELFRKQEEFQRHKLQNTTSSFVKGKATEKSKKLSTFDKKNVGVLQRSQKDYEEKLQEEDTLEKSRKMLEAKAKMYDQMTQGNVIPDEDGSGRFLVDFEQKALVQYREEKLKKLEAERREAEEERDMITKDEDIPPPVDPGEEWVEYTDSLGRSRQCMRKDLDDLIKQDKSFQQNSKLNMPEPTATLLSQDMKRELQRQKWEKEEEESRQKDTIHYADVQFDEIRAHGTGYYKLSGDEDVRKEQFDTLNKLRDQTIIEREKKERLKEKRKAMLDARLAKVKQRKRIRAGGTEEEVNHEVDADEEIGPKIEDLLSGSKHVQEEKSVNEQEKEKKEETLIIDEKPKKDAAVREWDKGKEKFFQMSGAKYMEERRQERISEFAPPTAFYDASSRLQRNTNNKKDDNVKTHQRNRQFAPSESYSAVHLKGNTDFSDGNDSNREQAHKSECCVEKKIKDVPDIPLPPEPDSSQHTASSGYTVNYQRDTPLQSDVCTPVSLQHQFPNFIDANYQFPMNECVIPNDQPVIYNPSVPPPNTFHYMQPPMMNRTEYMIPYTSDHMSHLQQGATDISRDNFQQSVVSKDKLKIIDTRNVKNKLALETVEGELVTKVIISDEPGENISHNTLTDTNCMNVDSESNTDVSSPSDMQTIYSSQPVLYKTDTK